VYIQEAYGDRVEFPLDDGKFELNDYGDAHSFVVNGSLVSQGAGDSIWRTPVAASSSATSSAVQTRKTPLATLKIIRADIGSNGKPTNLNFHNLTAHINLYNEEDANVSFINKKTCTEMGDDSLVLTGANGLLILDQDGTRGKV